MQSTPSLISIAVSDLCLIIHLLNSLRCSSTPFPPQVSDLNRGRHFGDESTESRLHFKKDRLGWQPLKAIKMKDDTLLLLKDTAIEDEKTWTIRNRGQGIGLK